MLDAIAEDPQLTARQRAALREVYEAFVATSKPRPGRPRPRTKKSNAPEEAAPAPRTARSERRPRRIGTRKSQRRRPRRTALDNYDKEGTDYFRSVRTAVVYDSPTLRA